MIGPITFVCVAACLLRSTFATCPLPPIEGNNTKSDKCLYPEPCNCNITASPDTGYGPDNSPYWETSLSPGGDHDASDDVCVTYFPLGNNCYTVIRYVVYKNDSCNIQRFITSPVPGGSGVYRYGGQAGPAGCDTCVVNDYPLAETCPGSITIYRCYMYGGCNLVYVGRDYVAVFSTSPDQLSQECYDKSVAEAKRRGLRNSAPLIVPQRLGPKCAYKIGNNTCINSERIPCEQRVTLGA